MMASLSLYGQRSQDSIPCGLLHIAELMIEKSPQIQRQKLSISQARADRQTASSAFDHYLVADLLYDRDYLNLFPQDSRFESTDGQILANDYRYTTGIQRTFRTGLTSSVNLDYSRLADNLPFNTFGEDIGPFIADNGTSLRVSLRQPLIRGRGRRFTTANERFYGKLIEQNTLDLTFVSSTELLNMSYAYWEYLGSARRLTIYKENENRIRRVLEITEELVEADRKAKNDLIQIQADLADKERQTLAAAQALYRARQNLGRSIGLNEGESLSIGTPLNPFPSVEEANYSTDIELAGLISLAQENRMDLKALHVRREAQEIVLDQANNALKPQLDVLTSISYGGTDEGNGIQKIFTPLEQSQGRNVRVGLGLSLTFPLDNNAAKAGLLRNTAVVSDQQIVIDNQIRNIELNISIALNELHNSVLQLEKSYQTLVAYEQVFADEQVKFQNGLTTLLNLILFQERLTFAQLDYLQAQQAFAHTIIDLRNETGTLLPHEGNPFPVGTQIFYQLPE